MSTILSADHRTTASYIVSEVANGHLSREQVIIASGSGKLKAGTVLGKTSIGAVTSAAKSGGNTGNGTITGLAALPDSKPGIYKLRFTAATTWSLTDPDGFGLAGGANGVANANDVAFTTTAGGTPFVAGDGFDITVAAGNAKYKPLTTAAVDGTEIAVAVLFQGCDATSVDVRRTITARQTEVQAAMLTWPVGITDSQKNAALASLAQQGIIAR